MITLRTVVNSQDRGEPLAHALSRQAVYFADFVDAHRDRFPILRRGGKALVQAHCHHHAVRFRGVFVAQ